MMKKLAIPQELDEKTLLEAAAALLPELKASQLKKMIKTADIKINGRRLHPKDAVRCGDIAEIYLSNAESDQPIEIVYEDRNILVVNKQPGLLVADMTGTENDLYSLVAEHMRAQHEYIEQTGNVPYPCYALERYTGGLTLFTKNGEMCAAMRQVLHERRLSVFYNALLAGVPDQPSRQLQSFIYENPKANRVQVKMQMERGFRPAATRYRVLTDNGEVSCVEIEPLSMRRHQIRVHMAQMSCPILGDSEYGNGKMNKKYLVKYQALWATKLVFHTGPNNILSYLDGKEITTDHVDFPYVLFE